MRTYKNGITIYDEVLPRHMLRGRECFWWEKQIGLDVTVEYISIQRVIKILGYKKRFLTIEQNGIQKKVAINQFINRGGILDFVYPDRHILNINWRYEIGETVNNSHVQAIVIDRFIKEKRRKQYNEEYDTYERWYTLKCTKCGYDKISYREDCINNMGCRGCMGIEPLINTHPELAEVVCNDEDMYKYSKGQHVKIQVRCPICGSKRYMWINNLIQHGVTCYYCSDGYSYGEKYVQCLLDLLKVKYIKELSCADYSWCGKYRYDYYLIDYSTIIEVHGNQHYTDTSWSKVETVQQNDYDKYQNALNHVERYIVINAMKSKPEYIKNSIETSDLCAMFDLYNIDWDACHKEGLRSIGDRINDLWLKEYSINSIAKQLQITSETVRKYLKSFSELGLNNYGQRKESV